MLTKQAPVSQVRVGSRRCLIVADGFYEWQKTDDGKQPYHIRVKGEEIRSYSIVTTDANDLMNEIHHRMPVILPPKTTGRGWTPASTTRRPFWTS